ncbi:hypothetical protein GUJ93_ZPchr0009g2439 [Zizania palustris]|uniref:Uncharacterized protein n=1 Tax=Zizania palustris TaxID=103762 RepID=A0A8J5UZF7_ZIZPA|nr:hypothetical protein GUJ93_ZPchr0009g2439 [Zizania palustris]
MLLKSTMLLQLRPRACPVGGSEPPGCVVPSSHLGVNTCAKEPTYIGFVTCDHRHTSLLQIRYATIGIVPLELDPCHQ